MNSFHPLLDINSVYMISFSRALPAILTVPFFFSVMGFTFNKYSVSMHEVSELKTLESLSVINQNRSMFDVLTLFPLPDRKSVV